MNLTLPWPPKELSPNARLHHMQLAKAKAKYRSECGWFCKSQGLSKLQADGLHLALTFHPPTRRHFDLDNLLARMKAAIDAISDVTGVNDRTYSLSIARGEPVKGGLVALHIKEVSE